MKHATKTLLAALLITACPVFAQEDAGVAEAETEIEIINGVPVNPELKKMIMESEKQLSVQELIEMANKVMQEQEDLIVLSTFASNAARMHTVAKAAEGAGRKVILCGRSLNRIDTAA
ncbi:MAG: hypothetical protein AB8C95_01040, partial [Phycisphaeraceae bacterium]